VRDAQYCQEPNCPNDKWRGDDCRGHWAQKYGHDWVDGSEEGGQTIYAHCENCQVLYTEGLRWEACHRKTGQQAEQQTVSGRHGDGLLVLADISQPKVAQGLLSMLMQAIPACPDCHKHDCFDWAMRWVGWTRNVVLSEFGVMSAFVALVARAGGEVVLPKEEMREARRASTFINILADPEGNHVHLQVETADKAETPNDGDEENLWPDLIMTESEKN
jgi:hypothetical protein